MFKKFPTLLFIFLCLGCKLMAQDDISAVNPSITDSATDTAALRVLQIADVMITGNEKTREYVIRREIAFEEGDVLSADELDLMLQEANKRITNTRLFLSVKTSVVPLADNHVRVLVELRERWYIVPMPIFKLADRNFNDWWTNQNRDLSRVNYGVRFSHYNFMGRSERLGLVAQFGYTRLFRLAYSIPYIDKSRKNGLSFNFHYFDNNDLPLKTVRHKRVFVNHPTTELRKTYIGGMSFSRRSSFYTTHYAGAAFVSNTIADTVSFLNPEYLSEAHNTLRYFTLSYGFSHDLRDNISYPLKGFDIDGSLIKRGLGIYNQVNQLELNANFGYFIPLSKRLYLSNVLSTRFTTPARQPYFMQNGLGYGLNYVRGMELYVIEGQHHLLNKTDLKWQLFKREIDLGRWVPLEQFSKIPIALYPKIYFDAAYVSEKYPVANNDMLLNKPVWGTGAGIDIVSFYDFVFQLEYSLNSLMERGTFIHINKNF